MAESNSPMFAAGLVHGAYDAARPARMRRGYHPALAGGWMYRRGFAAGFLAARRGTTVRPMTRPATGRWAAKEVRDAFRTARVSRGAGMSPPVAPGADQVSGLLAQLGRLDTRQATIEAMQRGLDAAWAVLDAADTGEGT
jgi:hypothetical protein